MRMMFDQVADWTPAGRRNAVDDAAPRALTDTARLLLLVGAAVAHDQRLQRSLRREGFAIRAFEDAEAALEHFETASDVGLVVLDIDASPVAPGTLLTRFLETRAGTPLAVVSDIDDEAIEEAVLDRGAHEFLHRRRRPSILAKRLRLLALSGVGGLPQRAGGVARIGALSLRLASHRAAWNGRPVDLTLTEFRIVRLLATRAGDEVSYREIYDEVHGVGFTAGDGPDGFRTNVRSLIRKIRAKFRALDDAFDRIENYPGFGYRWRAPAEGDAAVAGAPAAATNETPTKAHACAEPARRAT